MPMLDVFNDDAFSMVSLTEAIDKLPYKPGRLGEMGLFTEKSVTVPYVAVEERQGTLSLVPTATRGSQGQATSSRPRRTARNFTVPHMPKWDAIAAADVEGIRAFGSETELEMMSDVVNEKLESMKADHEVTREYHRIGAVHGRVLDADGSSTVVNWFTEWGISQTEYDFNYYDAGTYDDADPATMIKSFCVAIIRLIRNALGATPFTGVHCFAGDNWFDRFIEHAGVRRAYDRWQDGQALRDNQIGYGVSFPMCGIEFENYRGFLGDVDFVDPDEAVFFPVGARGVFTEAIAPADFVETINTKGIPIYAKQERMKWDKGIELHTQSNILAMCNRPKCLIKSTLTNTAPGTGS
jgi:hypothetical protein